MRRLLPWGTRSLVHEVFEIEVPQAAEFGFVNAEKVDGLLLLEDVFDPHGAGFAFVVKNEASLPTVAPVPVGFGQSVTRSLLGEFEEDHGARVFAGVGTLLQLLDDLGIGVHGRQQGVHHLCGDLLQGGDLVAVWLDEDDAVPVGWVVRTPEEAALDDDLFGIAAHHFHVLGPGLLCEHFQAELLEGIWHAFPQFGRGKPLLFTVIAANDAQGGSFHWVASLS